MNLYLPSTLKWTTPNGAKLVCTQSGNYPLDGKITILLTISRPAEFDFSLRIPAWSNLAHAAIHINGSRVPVSVRSGFATLHRRWNSGDRVELNLALPLRLQPIDAEHPNTVALVRGPLVLFACAPQAPRLSRPQLLAPKQIPGDVAWQVETADGPLRMAPFTLIGDDPYVTYLDVS